MIIAGLKIQGERSNEVLEVRDHGRGHLVCPPGGSLTLTGQPQSVNTRDKIFMIIKILRPPESMTSPTPHLSSTPTEFTTCSDPRPSMDTASEVRVGSF